MVRKAAAFLLAAWMTLCLTVCCFAAETTEASVPVTLTVVNTASPISVTVPASLPVTLMDGHVVTATDAKITNNASRRTIRVTAVTVQPAGLQVGCFASFVADGNSIALSINGCGTVGPGSLPITEDAFPAIRPGGSLPIRYQALVSVEAAMKNYNAATVIFTIAADG